MPRKRLGRQTPTQSYILPYKKSLGTRLIGRYEKTGRKAMQWQKKLWRDIMAVNRAGLFVHTRFGYSIPRRNGKNEIVAGRELDGLIEGERILHTAHRSTTSHAAWERLCKLLADAGYVEKEDYKTTKQFGLETIRFLDSGGVANFRTRSSKSGLGEGYDLLVIDEAQEYTADQESALKYVVSDSANPQTILCGTPPTPVSSGTVFTKLRAEALGGGRKNTGWAEWSVEHQSAVDDVELWYETNPSMGTILTERKVADEITGDDVDFNIQRLGLWISYNQQSAISRAEWEALQEATLPPLSGKLFVGVKFGHDGKNAAMSLAVRTQDDRIFLEALDCRSVRGGLDWILGFLRTADVQTVVVDGASGQRLLAEQMRDMGLKRPTLPTVQEVIQASAAFEQGLQAAKICHLGQPSLTRAISNCEKRAIGSGGGFGYRAITEDVEIALMESAVLAYWACAEGKTKKIQTVSL